MDTKKTLHLSSKSYPSRVFRGKHISVYIDYDTEKQRLNVAYGTCRERPIREWNGPVKRSKFNEWELYSVLFNEQFTDRREVQNHQEEPTREQNKYNIKFITSSPRLPSTIELNNNICAAIKAADAEYDELEHDPVF